MITYPARPINGGPPHLRRPAPGSWIAQPKFNGWRALVLLDPENGDTPPVWNRHGKPLSIRRDFPAALDAARRLFPPGTWLDCEALHRRGPVHGTLVILDYLDPSRPHLTYAQRRRELTATLEPLPWYKPPSSDSLALTGEIPQLDDGQPDLQQACAEFARRNQLAGDTLFEGVVCKRLDSPYPIQTRSPDTRFPYWIKHRFA